jgi:adenosylcobyric acid synthase
MHMGRTVGPDCERAFASLDTGARDGAVSANGQVFGTYVHGLFSDDRQRTAWLKRFAAGSSQVRYDEQVESVLDTLAAHLEAHVDIDGLLKAAR